MLFWTFQHLSYIVWVLLITGIINGNSYMFRRYHGPEEARDMRHREFTGNNTDAPYDVAGIENFLRHYIDGPQNDRFMYFNHDSLAVYVGPLQKKRPHVAGGQIIVVRPLRGWAMFDKRTMKYCELNAIFDFGELALFTCPEPGLYRAYSITYKIAAVVPPTQVETNVYLWITRKEKDQFNLLTGDDQRGPIIFQTSSSASTTPEERMDLILRWESGDVTTTGTPGLSAGNHVVTSDSVVVRASQYCYYWLYHLTMLSDPEEHHVLYELNIWIAEPSAVGFQETTNVEANKIVISDYSRVITNRFYTTGLFPCIRKAHPAIEIVEEIRYAKATDQSKVLEGNPHWRALIRVHTDRIVSTLSDVSFTIASRQNTGSFHCFVGDTQVYLQMRGFEFVGMKNLGEEDINLDVSNIAATSKLELKFKSVNVAGHGVHHIGLKGPKRYQPASNRSDMMIVINPCVAQEFAFSVGGSLYIAESFLQRGTTQVKKVVLPFFPDSKNQEDCQNARSNCTQPGDFLRIYDVSFTPTHVAFLMSEGYVVLHSPSAVGKGLADIKDTMKYRPDSFVKRRWCPRTTTPKISGMILPIYGTKGSIIILQVYPTESNIRIWFSEWSPSCLAEGHGFVKKDLDHDLLINETEIHYEEFSSVIRTNQKTGLREPPPPFRPPPPPPIERNLHEEPVYLVDSEGKWIGDGEDPHFPPELIHPASHAVSHDLTNYNQAVIYIIEDADGAAQEGLLRLLKQNGLTKSSSNNKEGDTPLAAVEFTVEEKQFIFALVFKANEIPNSLGTLQQKPFQMIISTLRIQNFPYRVRLEAKVNTDQKNLTDERLASVAPFPGGILIRSKPYQVHVKKSLDSDENAENTGSLSGNTLVDFTPEIFPLGTAVPSYVLNLGDVLVYSSIENRNARPLHYYSWDVVDNRSRSVKREHAAIPAPLTFENCTTKFEKNDTLYDAVVTEQGIVSVLWRKKMRHLIMDDSLCFTTEDSDQQTVALGSALVLEGLREVKPFFRNDNIFQRATPDGEIVYGVFDVKPRVSWKDCEGTWAETIDQFDPCVDQPDKQKGDFERILNLTDRLPIPVCTPKNALYDTPCRDPGYIEFCKGPVDRINGSLDEMIHACLRLNQFSNYKCPKVANISGNTDHLREDEEGFSKLPQPLPGQRFCDNNQTKVMKCFPKHATRQEVRTINILGTSFRSYLLGSLQDVSSIHPESFEWEEETRRQEPDICPFASFEIYYKQIDFAEVGYQTRITGEISYFGTGIPTEADILVEFDRHIGIITQVSSNMVEERHFTTIRKTIDVRFEMTDYLLHQLLDYNPEEKLYIRRNQFSFEDLRAREPFSVFSITLRPSIVNTRCKNSDYFKTLQFNIGCNAHSSLRLISEATPLKPINWFEVLNKESYTWVRDEEKGILQLPKQHIYYQQVRKGIFKCDNQTGKCDIPYYHLFKNNIFTISYRDFFKPQFEQFLTVSSRAVTGNVVLYDMLGSHEFNWTLNKMYAGCQNTEGFWYLTLLDRTKEIGKFEEVFEHENIYLYYKDCFSSDPSQGEREQSQNLYVSPFYFFNKTNDNQIKFLRKRNQLFIFRAAVLNTKYNRFTYCKHLDTYFMVRVTGIPIPRQGLHPFMYVAILLFVLLFLIISYVFFSRFYSGINTSV